MRKGGQLSFILVMVFLATQFISILGTMCVFAAPENISNYEDMSPEHIVPLDPFLAGGHSGQSVNRTSNFTPSPMRVLELLPQFLWQLAAIALTTHAVLRCPARLQLSRRTNNLWLLNRVLRI